MYKVKLRLATLQDVAEISAMEREVWDESSALSIEQIMQCINNAPQCNIVAQSPDGRICGMVSFCQLNYSKFESKQRLSWYDLSGNGTASTHNPMGADIFGINLGVTHWADKNTSTMLMAASFRNGQKLGAERFLWGSRMPGFHRRSHKLTAEQYWKTEYKPGVLLDPELRFYSNFGATPIKLVENYFNDPASLNYGVIFEYKIPHWVKLSWNLDLLFC